MRRPISTNIGRRRQNKTHNLPVSESSDSETFSLGKGAQLLTFCGVGDIIKGKRGGTYCPFGMGDGMQLKRRKNFTEGPIFFRMLLFSLPIMATGILQIFYSMADNIVVGQFSGDPNALGAVGSTSSLTNLTVNLLFGMAGGAAVVIAQSFGAGDDRVVSRTVHTALGFSLVGGIFFGALGFALSRPVLMLMGTRPQLLEGAVLYFRIICVGIPANSLYNMGASVLRSVGDSKTPLFILASTGLGNVGLNFLFVLGCGMSVAGVGIATVAAQYLSACAVLFVLWRRRNLNYGFHPKRMCFDKALFLRVLRFGLPAGIQGSLFSFSNILLTGGVNSLGDHVIKAYTIANNIDAITYTACNSFHQTALTFTGQNYGARKYARIRRVIAFVLLQVTFFGIVVAQGELLFSRQLSELYVAADDPNREEIILLARQIMEVLLNTYFLCGLMDVLCGILKGLGHSFAPMIVALCGVCGLRVLWVLFVFPLESMNSHVGLCLSYPVTWTVTGLLHLVTLIFAIRKLRRMERAGVGNVALQN